MVAAAVAGVLIAVGGTFAVLSGSGAEQDAPADAAGVPAPMWSLGLPQTAPPVATLPPSPKAPAVSTPTSADDRCIQAPAGGGGVGVAACDGSAGQRWGYDEQDRLWYAAGAGARCLIVRVDAGFDVRLGECTDAAPRFAHQANGTLRLAGTDRCLTILDTALLSAQPCTGAPTQVWRMPARS